MGATSQDGLPAEERKGLLWDALRTLKKQGWAPDTYSYTTAFRRARCRSYLFVHDLTRKQGWEVHTSSCPTAFRHGHSKAKPGLTQTPCYYVPVHVGQHFKMGVSWLP